MKNIKRLLILGLVLAGIFSCKKFLTVDPPYTQDAENYFKTPEDYDRALVGAYDLLQTSFMSLWIGEIASDNAIAGGESANDSQGLHQIDAMNHGGVNIDFPEKAHILAEAKFLRAYYYFELVKFFGDVPLVIDKRLGIEEVRTIDRSPKADVYAQIEKDLKEAYPVLNAVAGQKGRATKGAAQALLGKVYLYQSKWTEADDMFDDVITSGLYSLHPSYTELFDVAHENNTETVFDIQYSGLEGGGYGCLVCLEGNAAPGFQGIRQYNGPVYGDGNSYNLPTQDLYNFFPAGDPRRAATILDIEAFIAAQPNPSAITYAIGAGGHTGYYNNKYIKRQGEIGLPDNDLTSPVNYRVIRYADVLLMSAEANYHLGNTAIAQTYVNQIRSRVSIPGVSVNSLDKIYNERRFELSGEGHRFFDLVRTGKAATAIPGFIAGKHEVFPIPQVEIDLAGGRWPQNPGY